MSAKQWRMSPTRYLPQTSGSIVLAQDRRHHRRDLAHGVRLAAADVERAPGGRRRVERQPAGLRDVVHADEVAPLAGRPRR